MFATSCLLFASEASSLSMAVVGLGALGVYVLKQRLWNRPQATNLALVSLPSVPAELEPAISEQRLAA